MIFNLVWLPARQTGSSTRTKVLLRIMLRDTTVCEDDLARIIHEAGKQRHRIVENQLVSGEVKSGAEAIFRLDHDCSENF